MSDLKATQFPSDILYVIFEQYSLEETMEYPLETLLLVCRFWREAALDHHALWGRINVTVGHRHTFDICLARVVSRLRRSGPTTFLHICIIKDLKDGLRILPKCAAQPRGYADCCEADAPVIVTRMLDTLAGISGEYCARWKSLEIRHVISWGVTSYEQDRERQSSLGALRYPMPALTDLHLACFNVAKPIIPSSPNLTRLHVYYADIPFTFDLSHVREITYSFAGSPSFAFLLTAKQLRKLTLKQHRDMWLAQTIPEPFTLPLLEELSFSIYTYDLTLCTTPQLKRLLFDGLTLDSLIHLAENAPGIPLHQIEYLSMRATSIRFSNGLDDALRRMSNLKHVDASWLVSALILKLAWEAIHSRNPDLIKSRHPFFGREVTLHVRARGISSAEIVLSGKETVEHLAEFIRIHDLPSPELSVVEIDDNVDKRF